MFTKKASILRAKKHSKIIKAVILAVAVIASSCIIAYGWQKYDEKKYPDGAEKDYKLPNAFLEFFQMASDFMNKNTEEEELLESGSEQSSSVAEEEQSDVVVVVGDSSESFSSSEEEKTEPEIVGGIAPKGEAVSEFAFRNALFIGDYFVSGISAEKYFAYSSFASAIGYDINTIQIKDSFKLNGEALTMAEYVASFENITSVYIVFSAESVSWMDCPTFIKKYTDFLDSVIAAQPDADIYIQPLLPINEKQAEKKGYSVTNEKINEINTYLLSIAEKKKVWYLDMTEEFLNYDDSESEEVSTNGIRLTSSQYAVWYNYVITHRV